jgi:hypothetical protein
MVQNNDTLKIAGDIFQCAGCKHLCKYSDGFRELIEDGCFTEALCCSKKCMKKFVVEDWKDE